MGFRSGAADPSCLRVTGSGAGAGSGGADPSCLRVTDRGRGAGSGGGQTLRASG